MRFINLSNKSVGVLAFTGYYLPGYKGGGPIKTIANLLANTGKEVKYSLITKDRDLGDTEPYTSVQPGQWNQVGGTSVFYSQAGIKGLLQILKILTARKYDVVYLNSFFSVRFSFFPLLIARFLGQKVVLGPRGEFSEGALSLKSGKKNLFLRLYRQLRLHKRILFQASSEFEAEDIRRTLGDGVDIWVAENIGSQDFANVVLPKDEHTLKAVFVSRISPKKNLLGAIEMLAQARELVVYDIYGPREDEQYWAACQEKINMLPANVQVNYKGPLSPQEVVNTITRYDVFYMPTKGENYGHVIAEALCAGLPLLIADTTPWRDLQEKGLGWDLPLANPKAFASALDQLATMTPEEHLKMRENVLAWAKHKFAQPDAIEANIAMFRYAYEKKH
jgi:glycosyltransferase involved in cell wall biosynthesis